MSEKDQSAIERLLAEVARLEGELATRNGVIREQCADLAKAEQQRDRAFAACRKLAEIARKAGLADCSILDKIIRDAEAPGGGG